MINHVISYHLISNHILSHHSTSNHKYQIISYTMHIMYTLYIYDACCIVYGIPGPLFVFNLPGLFWSPFDLEKSP